MIIKIKTPGENNWRFFDNATSVQTSEIPLPEVPQIPEEIARDGDGNFGFANGDLWEEVLMNAHIPTSSNVTLISFMVGDVGSGRAVNLYTNAPCYLLNDSGKTIERIY